MDKNAGWIEISDREISAFNFYTFKDPNVQIVKSPEEHGLSISGDVTVVIDKDSVRGDYALITTDSGEYKYEIQGIAGYEGSPLGFADRSELSDVSLSFGADAYASDIWIYGDSYLNQLGDDRWPYYMYQDGYTDVLLSAFPGEGATRAIEDFELSLTRGTPKYAVWILGMNNGEGELEEPNPAWLEATERFVALCKERSITPVLSTIPNTPKINNRPKNEWVRTSGSRYIDFNLAVAQSPDPNPSGAWLAEMLSADEVHPLAPGAKALYARVLVDFPEIKQAKA